MILIEYVKVGRESVHEFLDMERSAYWQLEKKIYDCKLFKGHSNKNMVIYRIEAEFSNVNPGHLVTYFED